MTGISLLGLGMMAYGIYKYNTLKTVSKENEDKLSAKVEDLQKENQEYWEKEQDAQGANVFGDLEIYPELHMDASGGNYMSMLWLRIKNNSKTQTYRIDDIRATMEVLGIEVNTLYPRLKDHAVNIAPEKTVSIPVWVRMGRHGIYRDYGEWAITSIRPNYWKTENLVFFDDRLKEFQEQFELEISNGGLDKVIESDDVLIAVMYGGLLLPELSIRFKTQTMDWEDITINRVRGNLKVYFAKRYPNALWGYDRENTYKSLKSGEISWEPQGGLLRSGKPFEEMDLEKEIWNDETKTTDTTAGVLGWFYTDGKIEQFPDTGINDRQSKDQ